jgi:carbamoyl-phosphate synthase large subunit
VAPIRVLITGAGGPSAISVWKSLAANHEVHMADMDPCAAGLYLVPEERRLMLPRGDDPRLVPALLDACARRGIDLLIPTVDAELAPVAGTRALFEASATHVALSPVESLRLCRDKNALLAKLDGVVPVPFSIVVTRDVIAGAHAFPYFAKPRLGAGSRGADRIDGPDDLARLPVDGSYLLQEFLPGDEFSVDVYVSQAGNVLAAVPRLRMKIDSGIAVAARTVHDPELSALGTRAALATGVRFAVNVQFRRSRDGVAKLLEINPRFPGTLPLTTAAGVDFPALLVADFAGEPLPAEPLPFREVMTVRYLTECVIDPEEWRRLCHPAPPG